LFDPVPVIPYGNGKPLRTRCHRVRGRRAPGG
jgi:hypothetical protein